MHTISWCIYFDFSTCFGQLCAHHQENLLYLCDTGIDQTATHTEWKKHRRCCLQAASSVHYTTSCKLSLVLLRMCEIIARNMLSWLQIINKFIIVASSWLFMLLLLMSFVTGLYYYYYYYYYYYDILLRSVSVLPIVCIVTICKIC